MRGLIPFVMGPVVLAALLLGACASVAPPADSNSSIIAGRLIVDMSGVGTANNGADGMLNTGVPAAAALTIRNTASGKTYETRTEIPGGFFLLTNVPPGRYSLVGLWAQVKTLNAYITLRSDFTLSPTFDVLPGRVANLGLTRWRFFFDLTRDASRGGFTFGNDFPSVTDALARATAGSSWAGYGSDQAAFTGEASATSVAVALPPFSSGFDRILIP
jgi:hypothetical protein